MNSHYCGGGVPFWQPVNEWTPRDAQEGSRDNSQILLEEASPKESIRRKTDKASSLSKLHSSSVYNILATVRVGGCSLWFCRYWGHWFCLPNNKKIGLWRPVHLTDRLRSYSFNKGPHSSKDCKKYKGPHSPKYNAPERNVCTSVQHAPLAYCALYPLCGAHPLREFRVLTY